MYPQDVGAERKTVATTLKKYGADTASHLFSDMLASSYPTSGSLEVMISTLSQHV
ncbi:MAG: hypothetical protein QF415_04400 [Candidatus Undinarchaeales archaeon]|jgi:hypothetical protein|nr:hypothetical protein [Candidatus Undinarchaeales archaeon]MDP7492560.1 hypothetical protein [Candidatus Undinarchaeales archaeon]